ncbi:WhiB family transcriptional regulator [Kitasatospora sp. NPDC057223]|uniref:WhiB family transcriptional regulator n=1 Tax=Kitasatospora sp. NPDC057223 TaxID=3346055 RepID=UPI00364100F3
MSPDWTQARCGDDPDLFFLAGYSRAYLAQVVDAKAACAACPLLEPCRTEVMAREAGAGEKSRFGICGGMTPKERYRADTTRTAATREPAVP